MARCTTSIKIDPELWKEVKKHCIDEGTEISEYLERLIAQELANPEQSIAQLEQAAAPASDPDVDRRIELIQAYHRLIEKYGVQNVDRYHRYLMRVADEKQRPS